MSLAQYGNRNDDGRRHPRPSDHPPGGKRFGEEHGWEYRCQEECYWHHPESSWRWHVERGWKEY